MVIRLRGVPRPHPRHFAIVVKVIAVNVGAVLACVVFAVFYVDVAFAGVTALEILIAVALATVGAFTGFVLRSLPWPLIILAPIALHLVFRGWGPFVPDVTLGGTAALVFLLGTLGGREIKRLIRIRRARA